MTLLLVRLVSKLDEGFVSEMSSMKVILFPIIHKKDINNIADDAFTAKAEHFRLKHF